MKKLLTLIIVALIAWNGYLTYVIFSTDNNPLATNRPIINQSVSKITTDLTTLVDNCEPKVVVVSTYRGNTLYATGSGVVYQVSDGEVLIVTNNHVIEGGSSYKVLFASGEELEADRLVGGDKISDIAVLAVKTDLVVEAFKLGDSALTSVGEYVIAIGSPLGQGFQGSTTFGIISGKDRVIPISLNNNGIDDWDAIVLQTDAAINPGNSGGALVNLAGELIGITAMKINNNQVEGMGFAIPINEVVSIVEQIKENGLVKRPVLGISGYGLPDMSNMEKSYYNIDLSLTSGVYVTNVVKDSAAEKAGIRVGDIIIKMDNIAISDYKNFRQELYKKDINQRVIIEVIRDKQNRTFEAVLGSN